MSELGHLINKGFITNDDLKDFKEYGIYDENKIIEVMIRIQPDFIRHLKNQDKYCYMALDLNYKVIEHIVDQPLHYCLYAININANAIFYINKRTKELYDAAIKKDPKITRYLDIIY